MGLQEDIGYESDFCHSRADDAQKRLWVCSALHSQPAGDFACLRSKISFEDFHTSR
jgi:hypothetical protein